MSFIHMCMYENDNKPALVNEEISAKMEQSIQCMCFLFIMATCISVYSSSCSELKLPLWKCSVDDLVLVRLQRA